MQGLCFLLQVHHRALAMVQPHSKRGLLHVATLRRCQMVGRLSVILWSASDSGAVVPLCDFHSSVTGFPLYKGLSPPSPFGGVCALARARPRMQTIAAKMLLTIVLLWVDGGRKKPITARRQFQGILVNSDIKTPRISIDPDGFKTIDYEDETRKY